MFPVLGVVSIVIESDFIALGDEICIRDGCECSTGTIVTLEINRVPFDVAFPCSIIGVKLEIGIQGIQNEATVFKVRRLRLTLNESVEKKIPLEKQDTSDWLKSEKKFPVSFTVHGTYGGDQHLG